MVASIVYGYHAPVGKRTPVDLAWTGRARYMASLVAFVLGCLSLPAMAQEQLRQSSAQGGTSEDEPIDEVVVRGRSLRAMRGEVEAAQNRVFELFNAYNSNDDFDIRCSLEPRVGSHFKERVCRAEYVAEATSKAGRETMRSIQSTCPTGLTVCPETGAVFDNATSIFQYELAPIPGMDVALDEEVRRLVDENPEFAASIEQYRAKVREYRGAAERAATRRRR